MLVGLTPCGVLTTSGSDSIYNYIAGCTVVSFRYAMNVHWFAVNCRHPFAARNKLHEGIWRLGVGWGSVHGLEQKRPFASHARPHVREGSSCNVRSSTIVELVRLHEK